MAVRVRVRGGAKLRRQAAVKSAAVLAGVQAAVEESVNEIAEDERSNAPIGVTRNLRDGIEPRVDGTSGSVGVYGPAAEYAEFVEHGTSKMDAQPFALPAAERERVKLPRRVRDEVREALR